MLYYPSMEIYILLFNYEIKDSTIYDCYWICCIILWRECNTGKPQAYGCKYQRYVRKTTMVLLMSQYLGIITDYMSSPFLIIFWSKNSLPRSTSKNSSTSMEFVIPYGYEKNTKVNISSIEYHVGVKGWWFGDGKFQSK